jgi:hypothetical protein
MPTRDWAGVLAMSVACLSTSACGAPPSPEQSVEVTDSAGVRMVRISDPDRSLGVSEVVRFGLVDGDPNLIFDNVRALAIDKDGSIWMVDSYESVRHYSADGEYVGAVGASGTGPGESRYGYGDVWVAEAEVVVLAFSPTLQLFDKDGAYRGSRAVITADGRNLFPLAKTADGWLFWEHVLPDVGVASGREVWIVSSGDMETESVDSIHALIGTPRVAAGPGHWSNGSFFDGLPSIAGKGSGGWVYSHASEYRLEDYGEDGSLASVITRQIDRKPYLNDVRRSIESSLESAHRELGHRPEQRERERLLQATLPSTDPPWIPAIDEVLVAADGTMWVRRADQHPDIAARAVATTFGYLPHAWLDDWRADWVYDVLTPGGDYLGTARLPFNFVPMAVTPTRVYGTIRDELDVEYVSAFELLDPT